MSDWQATFLLGLVVVGLGVFARFVGWDWLCLLGIVVMVASMLWAAWHGKLVWEDPQEPTP